MLGNTQNIYDGGEDEDPEITGFLSELSTRGLSHVNPEIKKEIRKQKSNPATMQKATKNPPSG